ncbi:MAG: YHS domain-containing protein [Rhodospirillales bacterium]|nr:YHS domain-containing protein [Rhodospirillales bacterium]
MRVSKASLLPAFAFLGVLTLASVSPAGAVDEVNVGPGVTVAGAPLALRGYDPVAYFADGKPVQGSAKFTGLHNGVAYYFASQKNLDAFMASPAKYGPQYGGFCAYAVSLGKKFDGDPRLWRIIDGKFYVFVTEDVVAAFEKDAPGTLAKAEKNWPMIVHKAAKDL